jgi:hypothetical protein
MCGRALAPPPPTAPVRNITKIQSLKLLYVDGQIWRKDNKCNVVVLAHETVRQYRYCLAQCSLQYGTPAACSVKPKE